MPVSSQFNSSYFEPIHLSLHNIEADLFFPWMRNKVTSSSNKKEISMAFATVMDQLEEDRSKVAQLGQSIVSEIPQYL